MKVHVIRRAILKTLRDNGRVPMDGDEITEALAGYKAEAVEAQVISLQTLGYVLNVNNAAMPLYRLSAAGLTQIEQSTTDLDQNIWGAVAIK